MPLKGKIIILILLTAIIFIGIFAALTFYDFTQNNPTFCTSCHIMQEAYDAFKRSEHAALNCHDCHHLTIFEQNQLLITFALQRTSVVAERHGKLIVPLAQCLSCHWQVNDKYPSALNISRSAYHAKHVFQEKIECSKCHGYRMHQFSVEGRYCLKCHEGKVIHGRGMEQLSCLNCHTDRTKDLRPDREKCLYCHGSDTVRKELEASGTIDIKHFLPSPALVKKAVKIDVPSGAPMQFLCSVCHQPHDKSRPDWKDCLTRCHNVVLNVGKHELHTNSVGMKCIECHRPHSWKVSEEQAKKDCVRCHEYRGPLTFLR